MDYQKSKDFLEAIPCLLQKNWYSRPTPPDMQFEERIFQSQFSVSTDKLYEWNIDGLSEQEIINKMGLMSMVAITCMNNHNLDHPEIVELLSTGFSGTLRGWWDSYLTEDSRGSIKHAVKKNDDGFLIFDEKRNSGIPDGVNTLVYTILKHFVGTLTNVSSQVSDYLNNLRCPTMSDYRWYQAVFLSIVMLRKDCKKLYWKEKFIDGLPPIFAHKLQFTSGFLGALGASMSYEKHCLDNLMDHHLTQQLPMSPLVGDKICSDPLNGELNDNKSIDCSVYAS
ncbi:hypothetical protein SO802_011828 [Lithocarpus litseifolius]|uniref:DUF7746 domain-containing protein n=1 Tax=Lithocarpus litseifolius TaxID=425828 RepID=A0AAW2D132_9ROSI